MIEIKGISKAFDENLVLNNINLSLEDGKILALTGINGAGKSTLLRLISGIYRPDEGKILINGEDVYENENVKANIFLLPDEPFYDHYVTPTSITEFYKAYYKFDEQIYFNYLAKFNIPIKKKLYTFSKGMKRRVFISIALAIKPKYLLLDEAFDGLDPLARLVFKKAITDLVKENNTTIIISSHSLRELEDICDTYVVIDHKDIISSGAISQSTTKLHKYQIAFNELPNTKNFDFSYKTLKVDGRVVKIITEIDFETFKREIEKYNPLIIDEIHIDFEELFIIEVEERGYIND